jgi:hypothetical protein
MLIRIEPKRMNDWSPHDHWGTANYLEFKIDYNPYSRRLWAHVYLICKDERSSCYLESKFIEWELGWRRDNRKKVAALNEAARVEIEGREGRAWDMVRDFAREQGVQFAMGCKSLEKTC